MFIKLLNLGWELSSLSPGKIRNERKISIANIRSLTALL